jgi:hypothetical protein
MDDFLYRPRQKKKQILGIVKYKIFGFKVNKKIENKFA